MKSRILISTSAITLLLALAIPPWVAAQDNSDGRHAKFILFDAPGAGTGAGQGTYPLAINPRGVIAGGYYQADGFSRGFLRARHGTLTEFNAPGARGASAVSINPEGAVTGPYRELSDLVWHGYLRAPDGTFTEFEVPEAGTGASQGTFAYNINPAGAVAGYYLDENNVYHGYLRAPDGTITTFDATGAATGSFQGTYTCTVDCLNPQGAIAGSYLDATNVYHGYVRAPDGTITTFDVPGAGTDAYEGAYSAGINPAGTIGGVYIDPSGVNHGFVRAPDGTITTFDVPGAGTGSGQGTIPASINPTGDIVREYLDTDNVMHGFLRSKHGVITTFDVPNAGTGPFQGTVAECNNPANEITGLYVDQNNVMHGFLLTPCQEGDHEGDCSEHQEDTVEGNSAAGTQHPSTVPPANPAFRNRFPRPAPAPTN